MVYRMGPQCENAGTLLSRAVTSGNPTDSTNKRPLSSRWRDSFGYFFTSYSLLKHQSRIVGLSNLPTRHYFSLVPYFLRRSHYEVCFPFQARSFHAH